MKRLLLLCVSVASAHLCLAEVQLSAGLSGFQFQLVDLDPSDGIVPSISFFESRSAGEMTILTPLGVHETWNVDSKLAFTGFARSLDSPDQTTSISAVGEGLNNAAITVSVQTSVDAASVHFSNNSTRSNAQGTFSFWLSPRTELRVLADAHIFGLGSAAYPSYASAEVNASIALSLSTSSDFYGDRVSYYFNGVQKDFSFETSKFLGIAAVNETDSIALGSLYGRAGVFQDQGPATPVPEPASLWMLMGGGVGVAAMAMRRRRLETA